MNQNEIHTAAFKAMAEPVRLTIITMLAGTERCACELLEKLAISQPTLSHHMKTLAKAGLVRSRKNATWMYYSINREAFASIQRFMGSLIQKPARPAPAACASAKNSHTTKAARSNK